MMKKWCFLLALVGCFCWSATRMKGKPVKVHVAYTNAYCGGARPTPEILAAMAKENNLANCTLLLVQEAKCKRTKKVQTDSLGNFSAPLKSGTYHVYLTAAKPSGFSLNFSADCDKYAKLVLGKLIIEKSKGDTLYQLKLHLPCNPCQPPRP